MKTGIELIAAERTRQIEVEGWTKHHDDHHSKSEIVEGALSYAHHAGMQLTSKTPIVYAYGGPPPIWPWEASWWKPSPDPIRNLVKAGALIAAEIDRLQRKEIARDEARKALL